MGKPATLNTTAATSALERPSRAAGAAPGALTAALLRGKQAAPQPQCVHLGGMPAAGQLKLPERLIVSPQVTQQLHCRMEHVAATSSFTRSKHSRHAGAKHAHSNSTAALLHGACGRH